MNPTDNDQEQQEQSGSPQGNNLSRAKNILGRSKKKLSEARSLGAEALKTGAKSMIRRAAIKLAAQAAIAFAPWIGGAIIFFFFLIIIINIFIILFGFDKDYGAPPVCSTTASSSGMIAGKNTLSHTEAFDLLRSNGISVWSSGGCIDKNRKGCTSLEGIRKTTIDGIIGFKNMSGAPITITGGTETGHAGGPTSHENGFKVDIRSNGSSDKQSKYIKDNFKYVGERDGVHGGPIYKDALGNEYVYETTLGHWDITYINAAPPSSDGSSTATDSAMCNPISSGSTDDCSAKYADDMARNRFNHENWGDPACNYTTGDMDTALRKLDSVRWEKWHSVIKGESGLNPLAWADPGIGTPNPYGAWGLLQMGSQFKSNNQYDRGDQEWENQLSNAFQYLHNYNNNDPYKYWCQWNKLFPEGDGLGHIASRPNCR